jgi:uncharacterized protein
MLNLKTLLHSIITEAEKDKQLSANDIKLDKKVLITFIVVPFCLTMINYLGNYSFVRNSLLSMGAPEIVKSMDKIIYHSTANNLGSLCYWVTNLFLFYFIIPALTIKFIFKENLSDYGLKLKGAFKDYYLYIIMLMVMIPLVAYFSSTASFQERYPFLKVSEGDSLFPDLLKWELFYCAQFFALEFFFRGFILFGLKPKLGFYSVFVMTIPYCMIHFGKPMPETLAAIFAGIVLGCLSLKNRSVWLGFLIHCSVGVGMDLAALWQKGLIHF